MNNKILASVASVLVLAAVVAGFLVVGSPAKQRAIKFDLDRVNALSMIQSEIQSYWSRTNTLPDNLLALTSAINGFSLPKDPETKADYEYRKKGDLNFELCANFATENLNEPSNPEPYYYSYAPGKLETWSWKGLL